MADYTSPRPVDPLAYRLGCTLRIVCQCNRRVQIPLRSLQQEFRLLGNMRLYEIIDRLRCRRCGQRPAQADVVEPWRA